jgi:hypothetical protein
MSTMGGRRTLALDEFVLGMSLKVSAVTPCRPRYWTTQERGQQLRGRV